MADFNRTKNGIFDDQIPIRKCLSGPQQLKNEKKRSNPHGPY